MDPNTGTLKPHSTHSQKRGIQVFETWPWQLSGTGSSAGTPWPPLLNLSQNHKLYGLAGLGIGFYVRCLVYRLILEGWLSQSPGPGQGCETRHYLSVHSRQKGTGCAMRPRDNLFGFRNQSLGRFMHTFGALGTGTVATIFWHTPM